MRNFLKQNAGLLIVLVLVGVALAGGYWQGHNDGYAKAMKKAARQVDTTYIESSDTVIRYKRRYVHSVDTVPDTIFSQDVQFVPRDVPCLSDTSKTIVLYGGDSLVNTSDTLRIAGRMLWRKQGLNYSIPERTITNTRVVKMYRSLHNVYLTGSSNSSAGVLYGNRYFSAGYQYNWQLDQHVATLGVNLGMLWQKRR